MTASWVSVDELWKDAQKAFPELTKEEFLQHLEDLEKRGLIQSATKRSKWK